MNISLLNLLHKKFTIFQWFLLSISLFAIIILQTMGPSNIWTEFITVPTLAAADPDEAYDHLLWSLPGPLEEYADAPMVPGEVLVGFYRDRITSANALSGLQIDSVQEMDLTWYEAENGRTLVGKQLFVPPGEEWDTIATLMQNPAVAFAAPNWVVRAAIDPQPAVLKIDNVEAEGEYIEQITPIDDPDYIRTQWYLQRINAHRAWDLLSETDQELHSVRVAIIDSGIDVEHPEFEGRLTYGINYCDIDLNGNIEGDCDPLARPVDDYGHGTHVAGLMGAEFNNGVGIAGVSSQILIDTYKVLDEFGGGSIKNVSNAIIAATDNGAKIINMSLEAPQSHFLMQEAVEYANRFGVLQVAASGNFKTNVAYPASYPEVMAIAATGYRDQRAHEYSNYGSEIELAAPGGGIFEGYLDGVYSDRHEKLIYSTWPNGVFCDDWLGTPKVSSYCSTEGTSMSAALVTGAAALIWSVTPQLTANEVRQILIDSATPLPGQETTRVGSGRLDVHRALRMILPSQLQIVGEEELTPFILPSTQPYEFRLTLENESLKSIGWQASYQADYSWLQIRDTTTDVVTTTVGVEIIDTSFGTYTKPITISSTTGNITGEAVSYGQPDYLTLAISPTHLAPRNYTLPITLNVQPSDGTQYTQILDFNLTVMDTLTRRMYLPLIQNPMTPLDDIVLAANYRWEAPLDAEERETISAFDNSSHAIDLPISFNSVYTKARLYSDGFLNFSDSITLDAPGENHCLPSTDGLDNAIYGWWTDLDPSRGHISTFQPSSDRFVIEFKDVPTAEGVTPAYAISFQIVLVANGQVQLNYRDVPIFTDIHPTVTIGVEMQDGLFYNQIVCNNGSIELGRLPETEQTIILESKELY